MFIIDFLTSPAASPFWAGFGAAMVKLLDWLHARFAAKLAAKTEGEKSLHEHVNAATKQLIDTMMGQITTLTAMTTALQEELRETHRQLDDKIERVLQLEAEVILLRREMQQASSRRGTKPKMGEGSAQFDGEHK